MMMPPTPSPSYWLLKSEPGTFSIDDLMKAPDRTTCWEGVRNYQARNFLRAMTRGDRAFFYHSNADPPGIVGVVTIVREAYPDDTQFNQASRYHDPRSTPADPRWVMVDVRLVEKFQEPLTLEQLRKTKGLERMELLRKGSRLSVQPVRKKEWDLILEMAGKGLSWKKRR